VHSQVDTNDLKLTLTGGRLTTTVAAGRIADALHSAGQAVLADFYQYFAQIRADRRANPRDDLATVIATSQVDGRPISEFEAMSYYVIVATAGHDTTSSTTAGGDADVM